MAKNKRFVTIGRQAGVTSSLVLILILNGRVYGDGAGNRAQSGGTGSRVFKKIEKLCNYWLQENCSFGDKCKF